MADHPPRQSARFVPFFRDIVTILAAAMTFLKSPTLPSRILITFGAIAVVIIATGIGIWSIIGAWRVFMLLVSGG